MYTKVFEKLITTNFCSRKDLKDSQAVAIFFEFFDKV